MTTKTMLLANIRRRKAAFFSLFVMMLILSTALTSVLSVSQNTQRGLEIAMEKMPCGDLWGTAHKAEINEAKLEAVRALPYVRSVDAVDMINMTETETDHACAARKQRADCILLREDHTGYLDQTPALQPGEIYITQGAATRSERRIGDSICLQYGDSTRSFTIRGIVLDPMFGNVAIQPNTVVLCESDFDEIRREITEQGEEVKERLSCELFLTMAEDAGFTQAEFLRQINLDSDLFHGQNAISLTVETLAGWTNLYPEIICGFLLVFLAALLLVLLIIMCHSISTGIELDYQNLGILKAEGFTSGDLRQILLLQYLLPQLLGAIGGLGLAIPLIFKLGSLFVPLTGIPVVPGIALGQTLGVLSLLLLISACFIFVATRKLGTVSPVRAIRSMRPELYFNSRLQLPISGRLLSLSLALRQITSAKRRYFGLAGVAMIMAFFLLSVSLLETSFTSKTPLNAMGYFVTEVGVSFPERPDEMLLTQMDEAVASVTTAERISARNKYFQLNDESVLAMIYLEPEHFSMEQGRAPQYDNEITVTRILADSMGLSIGDEVRVSLEDRSVNCLITGYHRTMQNTGTCFGMPYAVAEQLGVEPIPEVYYSLQDSSKTEEVVECLETLLDGQDASVERTDNLALDETSARVIHAVQAFFYGFTVLFALVASLMVCNRVFLQEKRDIGIHKAMGFTTSRLRLQFALRFLLVAALGTALGLGLSMLLSAPMLSMGLHLMGITTFVPEYTTLMIMVPIVIILLCFFVFSWLAARKLKTVSVRELITE